MFFWPKFAPFLLLTCKNSAIFLGPAFWGDRTVAKARLKLRYARSVGPSGPSAPSARFAPLKPRSLCRSASVCLIY